MNNICYICHKEIKKSPFSYLNNHLCSSCFRKFPTLYKKIQIDNVETIILYKYDDFLRGLLLSLKAKKDLEISKIILVPVLWFLKCKYRNYTILTAPSSNKSNLNRGYNHVVEIFKNLNTPLCTPFYKINGYKQSSMKGYQRNNISSIIFLRSNVLDKNKKYLLVDDILTTGSTLKRCIQLLKEAGIKKIKCVVVASNFTEIVGTFRKY